MVKTADLPKPCAHCPWTDAAQDVDAIVPGASASAKAGDWFCCHVHMGTCWGAVRFGAAIDMPTTGKESDDA